MRARQLSDMRADMLRLADLEGAVNRFTPAELNEYVNKGLIFVYRSILIVQDRPFYQKDYSFITVGNNTSPATPIQTTYPLPPDFLQIMSVLWATSSSGPWASLEPYEEAERFMLINSGFFGAQWPAAYGIVGGTGATTQGTIPTAYGIEILPQPPSGSVVQIRYVPTPPRLVNDTDTFDGILGFEDAACTWGAVLMRRKDDLPTEDLERDMTRHMNEVRMIAKRRDRSRPPRVSIVRGRMGVFGRRAYGRLRGS